VQYTDKASCSCPYQEWTSDPSDPPKPSGVCNDPPTPRADSNVGQTALCLAGLGVLSPPETSKGGVDRVMLCPKMEMLQGDIAALDDQGASTWSMSRHDERVRG
jgi:hypothetical protein